MKISDAYMAILIAVPFVSIIIAGWILGAVPNKSFIGKMLTIAAEENLEDLMRKNGFTKTKVITFQIARLLFAIFIAFAIVYILDIKDNSVVVITILLFVLGYKAFYLFLLYKDQARINKLNTILPYTIKSIAYLACVFPVNNALIKAIPLVPKEFRADLEQLVNDIVEDPTTFEPYQKFIDRYDGRLNRLDYYLKTLHRMSESSTSEEQKLLSNLNATISDEMSAARAMKNKSVNDTVAYLGLIPVALMTIMLLILMVMVATAI